MERHNSLEDAWEAFGASVDDGCFTQEVAVRLDYLTESGAKELLEGVSRSCCGTESRVVFIGEEIWLLYASYGH